MKYVLLYAALAAAGLLCLLQMGRVAELEDKNNRLSVELAHAQIPMQRDTIRDTVEVVTQTVVEVVPKKMKEALAADQQLIKDLQLKVKQLEAVQTTVLQVGDTVPAQYRPHDSIFTYHDQCGEPEGIDLKSSTSILTRAWYIISTSRLENSISSHFIS